MSDCPRHQSGVVNRRQRIGLNAQLGARFIKQRRIHRGGHNVGHAHRRAGVLQFHAQRVDHAVQAVLRGGISCLVRHRNAAGKRRHENQRAAALLAQIGQGRHGCVSVADQVNIDDTAELVGAGVFE